MRLSLKYKSGELINIGIPQDLIGKDDRSIDRSRKRCRWPRSTKETETPWSHRLRLRTSESIDYRYKMVIWTCSQLPKITSTSTQLAMPHIIGGLRNRTILEPTVTKTVVIE
ncbi:hypothetical protein ACOME3_004375 [Neoechinorhynchus agilis]